MPTIENEVTEGLGERIREARVRAHWTRREVCQWANVDPTHLGKWEAGEFKPGAENLARLAKGLRVSADWLLGLDG